MLPTEGLFVQKWVMNIWAVVYFANTQIWMVLCHTHFLSTGLKVCGDRFKGLTLSSWFIVGSVAISRRIHVCNESHLPCQMYVVELYIRSFILQKPISVHIVFCFLLFFSLVLLYFSLLCKLQSSALLVNSKWIDNNDNDNRDDNNSDPQISTQCLNIETGICDVTFTLLAEE